jgi:hypothetical protein
VDLLHPKVRAGGFNEHTRWPAIEDKGNSKSLFLMKCAISNVRGQQPGGLAHFSEVGRHVTIIAAVRRFFFQVSTLG